MQSVVEIVVVVVVGGRKKGRDFCVIVCFSFSSLLSMTTTNEAINLFAVKRARRNIQKVDDSKQAQFCLRFMVGTMQVREKPPKGKAVKK